MADDDKTAETLAEEPLDLDASTEAKEEPKEEPKEPKTEGDEGESKEAGETAGEEPPKKPSGSARAKIRENRLLSELQAREREIEELRRSTPAARAGETTEEKPPREEDYNGDYFAWQRALTAFEAGGAARKAVRDEFKTVAESRRTEQQAGIARERQIAHLERVEDARGVITDFDTVMKEMDGVQVRQDVIDEIMSSDKSALLAYHLAKNPEKLQSLNQMSGRELAREMGRLEGSVRMPAAKLQTKAPAPLEPLKGGASGSFDPEKASMDDYVAKRKAGWKG